MPELLKFDESRRTVATPEFLDREHAEKWQRYLDLINSTHQATVVDTDTLGAALLALQTSTRTRQLAYAALSTGDQAGFIKLNGLAMKEARQYAAMIGTLSIRTRELGIKRLAQMKAESADGDDWGGLL